MVIHEIFFKKHLVVKSEISEGWSCNHSTEEDAVWERHEEEKPTSDRDAHDDEFGHDEDEGEDVEDGDDSWSKEGDYVVQGVAVKGDDDARLEKS